MIILHRLNGEEFMVNSDHIELIEEKPDTVITMANDKKYIVKEKAQEILHAIIEYRKRLLPDIRSGED